MERHREVGRDSYAAANRACQAKTGSEGRGLLLLRGSSLWRTLLRYTKSGERSKAAMSACFADERPAPSAGVRSAPAAASGKSAWLQDGQMDRTDRIH